MQKTIHFEQLMEEVRAANPSITQIWGTEQPLEIWAEGVKLDLRTVLAAHQPMWITANPAVIPADGLTPAVVQIESAQRADQTIDLHLQHGEAGLVESIQLDPTGRGEIEVVSTTPGEIQLWIGSVLVRTIITVAE